MKTLLLSNCYDGLLKDILEKAVDGKFNLKMLEKVSKEELLEKVESADYLLSSGRLEIDREVISRATNLKMVQRTGVGIDQIDIDALNQAGIPLYVNKGVNAVSVAEYTIMLILSVLKRSNIVSQNMASGKWEKTHDGIRSRELNGKVIGLIGMGNIGKNVAKMLSGFNVEILYYTRTRLTQKQENELKISFIGMEELLAKSDIVSLHCPYSKESGTIIADSEIEMMKDGVILINTARGKLVDENALLRGLQSGKISACGLDVFYDEPLDKDSILRSMEQVVISPHIAGLTYEAYERMLKGAVNNIWKFDKGEIEVISSNKYSTV